MYLFDFIFDSWNKDGMWGKAFSIFQFLIFVVIFGLISTGIWYFSLFIYNHTYNRIEIWKPTVMTITSNEYTPEYTHYSSTEKRVVTDEAYYTICGTFPIDDGEGHTVGRGCLDISNKITGNQATLLYGIHRKNHELEIKGDK